MLLESPDFLETGSLLVEYIVDSNNDLKSAFGQFYYHEIYTELPLYASLVTWERIAHEQDMYIISVIYHSSKPRDSKRFQQSMDLREEFLKGIP